MSDDVEKKKKKKSASKYNYSFGDLYPGVIIGHKECNPFANTGYPVPASMGWLWNAPDPYAPIITRRGGGGGGSAAGVGGGYDEGGAYGGVGGGAPGGVGGPGAGPGGQATPGPGGGRSNRGAWRSAGGGFGGVQRVPVVRRGWSPGVLGKSVAKVMTFKCPRGGADKDRNKKKKKRGHRPGGTDGAGGDSEPEEPLQPKPTLKVQRKGDVFTIQVNPLKDLTEIAPNEDPYVDCDPMVFKIIKKRSPEERAKVEARKMVKLKKQRDAEIRNALAEAVEDICKCAYMDVYCNDLTAIDRVIESCPAFTEPDCICHEESLSSLSSNATWDIEYTPPFGCFDLAPRKRLNFIHVETQYIPADAGIPDPPRVKCRKSCISMRSPKGKA